jgi:hypothetical protein
MTRHKTFACRSVDCSEPRTGGHKFDPDLLPSVGRRCALRFMARGETLFQQGGKRAGAGEEGPRGDRRSGKPSYVSRQEETVAGVDVANVEPRSRLRSALGAGWWREEEEELAARERRGSIGQDGSSAPPPPGSEDSRRLPASSWTIHRSAWAGTRAEGSRLFRPAPSLRA